MFRNLAITFISLILFKEAPAWGAELQIKSDPNLLNEEKAIRERLQNQTKAIKNAIVTVGPASLEAELRSNSEQNVISIYATSSEFKRILASNSVFKQSSRTVSAVFMDVDPRYPIYLANILSPVGKKVIPVTSETSLNITPELERFFSSFGAVINFFNTADTKGVLSRMDSADLLIAYNDKSLLNEATIKPIVSSLYRRKKILIGTSKELTSAGALASVETNLDAYQNQAISEINHFISSGMPIGEVFPKDFDVSVNKILGKALGLYSMDLDENALKSKIILLGKEKSVN